MWVRYCGILLRAPARLYEHGLGWILGRRFVCLTHVGRRSGRRYRTVLEVIGIDGDEVMVIAGLGPTSDWFRNLEAGSGAEITLGRNAFAADSRVLELAEAEGVIADYERRNRWVRPIVAPSADVVAGVALRRQPRRQGAARSGTAHRRVSSADGCVASGSVGYATPMLKQVTIAAALLTALGGCASNDSNNPSGSATTSGTAASGENMTAQLKTADGTPWPRPPSSSRTASPRSPCRPTAGVTARPGSTACTSIRPASASPTPSPRPAARPGTSSPRAGAFGPGHTGHPASGDLTSLEVRPGRFAKLVTTTEAFTKDDLLPAPRAVI